MYNKHYKKFGDSRIYMINSVNLNSSLLSRSNQTNSSNISRIAQKAFQGISDSFGSVASLLGRVLTELKEDVIDVFLLVFYPSKLSLKEIKKAGVLSDENKEAVISFKYPSHLAIACGKLNRAGILTQETFTSFRNETYPVFFQWISQVISDLKDYGILTPENYVTVSNHRNPHRSVHALARLDRIGILTQENFAVIMQHPDPYTSANALVCLHRAGIYNEDNRTALIQYQHREYVCDVLCILYKAGILNQENFDAVCLSRVLYYVHRDIIALDRDGILNRNNFSGLLQRGDRLDNALRSFNFWNRLHHVANNAINNNQSAHTASVHQSVSVSAIKLKEKYSSLSFEIS
jgi:hypothetical protein